MNQLQVYMCLPFQLELFYLVHIILLYLVLSLQQFQQMLLVSPFHFFEFDVAPIVYYFCWLFINSGMERKRETGNPDT